MSLSPTLSALGLLALTCCSLSACRTASAAPDDDRAAVTATVELYFQGQATGNGDHYRKAFHGDAKLFWVEDGALKQWTSAEFAAGANGKPANDEAKRARRIAMIDITGTAAIVKVELDYPKVLFTDYLSLLKLDGKWVVINKIFNRESRTKAPPAAVPSRK